jgi:hypothetical protein
MWLMVSVQAQFHYFHKRPRLLDLGWSSYLPQEPAPASSRQQIGLPFWETLAKELLLALSHAHYLAFWPSTLPVFFLALFALTVLSQHRPYLL